MPVDNENIGIQLNEVCFSFKYGVNVLEDINLSIAPGQIVAVIGPNGSGKSTLARLLNGSLLPSSGSVTVDGLLTSKLDHQLKIKRTVALIRDDPEDQLIAPTAFDEVAFALDALGLESDESFERAAGILDDFGLAEYRDTHPLYLSVGEQYRLLLASAIVRQPDYLILDEIFSMLDSHARSETRELLTMIHQQQSLALVLLTHRLEEIVYADRVILLKDGTLVVDDVPGAVLSRAGQIADWRVEAPLTFQVTYLLSNEERKRYPEIAGFWIGRSQDATTT